MKQSFLSRVGDLSRIGDIALRYPLSRAAPPIGDLSRIRDIALRYPLSRAAPYNNKNTDTYTLLCKHKYAGVGIFLIARLKPNVHIYTVSLPSGGLLLPGIARLGVRCLF